MRKRKRQRRPARWSGDSSESSPPQLVRDVARASRLHELHSPTLVAIGLAMAVLLMAAVAHGEGPGIALRAGSFSSCDTSLDACPREHPNRRCLDCHAKPHIAELDPEERLSMVGTRLAPSPGQSRSSRSSEEDVPAVEKSEIRPGLHVPADALSGSVHAKVTCVECHEDADFLPHDARLDPSTCAIDCHPDQARELADSAHADAANEGSDLAPRCSSCHGGHEMVAIESQESPVHRLNSVTLCGDCHRKHSDQTPGGFDPGTRIASFLDSDHGRAVTQGGLMSAATCFDCHSAHAVQPVSDPRSMVSREQVPETCGRCHLGVANLYAASTHGRRFAEHDEGAPVCTDCHTGHGVTRTATPTFMLDIVYECGECHDEPDSSAERRTSYYDTYRASYHGQVTELGSTRAARCSDCHGAHTVAASDDPTSPVHSENLTATCGQERCHPGANQRFVQFDPHADHRDFENYPVLFVVWSYFMVMMTATFGFFGLHTLLWFVRSAIERIRHGPPVHVPSQKNPIRRFTLLDRINHALVAITFLGLTATGIPLFFSDQAWAARIADLFGGIVWAGRWHRVFAVLLILNLIAHLAGVAWAFMHRKVSALEWVLGPNSLVPNLRDARDALGMFRWFFRGGEKPRFDRWTYWEKFDYMAEIGGSMIIGGTGLLLWFPMAASTVLPGWIFNIASIIHGYEALLAIGFIFTIHFFNANLRVEKFPVDEAIFTGSILEEEMKEERADEYERLKESGELEDSRVPPWPAWKRRVSVVVGIIAMLVGFTLVSLIILAGLGVL